MSGSLRILHVCTGNICRSPIAERLMRQGLKDRLGGSADAVVVESAGTAGLVGRRMEPDSISALAAYGLDDAGFLARELGTAHVAAADLVLTATRMHRAAVVRLQPRAAARTFTVREFSRLCASVDPSVLTSDDVADRGRALVRAAAGQRGRDPVVSPEDDDIPDPYRGPAVGFAECARLLHEALQGPLDLLAGARLDPAR